MITVQAITRTQKHSDGAISPYQVLEIDIDGDKSYWSIDDKINVDELIALQNKAAQA